LAIQICTGHFPDGRERHRTFSLKNIREDADDDALIAVVRAVGSLLAYPITGARLIVKKRRVLFGAKRDMYRGEDARAEMRGDVPERAGTHMKSVFAKSALTKIIGGVCLASKTFFEAFRGLAMGLSKKTLMRYGVMM
ncbi:MAG: hypothetical protein LBS35_00640, partial [Synergistaceae bacterium]|nr:hypothetical protein [Synergistaceae bacterium]